MTDKDRRTILWLAEIAAWPAPEPAEGAYRKAQVDYRQRNRLINAAILLQHEKSRRRPWYHRLWRAKENNPCSS